MLRRNPNGRGRRKSPLVGKFGLHNERGAAAVEAALILPLLIVLTFGIIEFALLMRDHTATTSLVRAGARTASALPRDTKMIAATVAAMEQAGSALPKDSYEEMWIYSANVNGYPGNAANTTFDASTCTKDCIRYAWNAKRDTFEQVSGTTWDPNSINACAGDPNSQTVGVYLKAKHTWITGLFYKETMVSDRAVLKFEPLSIFNCKR